MLKRKISLKKRIQSFYLLFWDEPKAKVQKNFYIFFIQCISFLTISPIFSRTGKYADYNVQKNVCQILIINQFQTLLFSDFCFFLNSLHI